MIGVGAILAVLVLAAGCMDAVQSGAASPGGGVPSPRTSPPPQDALPPTGCPSKIGDPAEAQRALNTAAPGDRICLAGSALISARLKVTRSGLPGAPIQVLADGAAVMGVDVLANQVVIAGFTIRDGGELTLRGAGLIARNNNVLNARMNGISCACSDTVIESNVVDGTDGTGILVEGDRVTVRGNEVSDSVRRAATDADGMRFFGTAIRISDNTVRDISATGYRDGDAPHPDCFQTYDSDAPPTYDVVISNNRCERVDMQCLIATAEHGNLGVPPGVRSITFQGNYCDVGGSQAVTVDGYPHVLIQGNTITGRNLDRGIHLSAGATDCAVLDNVMVGNEQVFETDAESQPVRAEGNRNQQSTR
jgi:nitrous oxidase accessory protein NosD